MKNRKKHSTIKDHQVEKSLGDSRRGTEERTSHKEVKILLAVVAGVLVFLIGGSAFVNLQNNGDARLQAMEEALLNNKSRMLRDYDPILVNAVEVHGYEVVHQGREYDHIAVEMAVPNLVEVYDDYFDQMIRQEVWLKEDSRRSLQDIYRRAVEQGGRSIYPLKEEVRLKEENGQWQVKNPEVLSMVLPHNPTEEIAEAFDRVLEEMEKSSDFKEHGNDPVLQGVMTGLLEEGFFNEVSFDWHRGQGQWDYRITAKFNEIMKMQEVGSLDDFRHRREEIVDHESLVQVITEEVRKKTANERDLKVFEIREVHQPNKEGWGYRLISRGGGIQYYRRLIEDVETFPHVVQMNFSYLENYYKTVQVIDGDPWPEALKTFDYEKHQVLARDNTGPDRRKLILEEGEIWYRIYDRAKGTVTEEVLITGDIQREAVLDQWGSPYSRNEISRREGYDVVSYGENGEHIYQVVWKPEPEATKIIFSAGNFHREEIFYLSHRPYHMGERGAGRDGMQKEIQLTDIKKEQVLVEKSYEQLSNGNAMLHSNYYVSEAHDILIVYYHGPKELVEEIFPRGSLNIYRGTEKGLEEETTLEEASRRVGGIQNFVVMDRDRVFLVNHEKEQWVLNLEEKTIFSVAPGPFEKAALEKEDLPREEASEEGAQEWLMDEFEDHHYRFTPLGEDLFYVELFIHSSGGGEEFRREIWTVTDRVTRNMVFSREDQGHTLSYNRKDDTFIAMKGYQEFLVFQGDPEILGSLTGDNPKLKIEDLLNHDAFTLLDRYERVNEGKKPGELMIYGQHYFFSSRDKFYLPENHQGYNPFRYDRDTGNLFFNVRGGDPYMRVLQRAEESTVLPLWDYQELSFDENFTTLYYRDHEGAKIYELIPFLDTLKDHRGRDESGDSGTE